jgi:hypothetical protein
MISHVLTAIKLPLEHLPTSIAVGFTLHHLIGTDYVILAALLGGWLIDADHLID